MQHAILTPTQTRSVLRALRQVRGLTQTQVGQLLGVNQKRIARIESAPHVTSFDQIVRLVSAMGGRVLIDDAAPAPAPGSARPVIGSRRVRRRKSTKAASVRGT